MIEERLYKVRLNFSPTYKDDVMAELRKKLNLNVDAPLEEIELIDKDVHYFANEFIKSWDIYQKAFERSEQTKIARGALQEAPDEKVFSEEELKTLWDKYNEIGFAQSRIFLSHYFAVRDGKIQ